MTTTLTTGISETDRVLVVTSDEDLPRPNSLLRIGNEAIRFLGPDRGTVALIVDVLNGDHDHWRVTRGAAGTTAAAHLSGATLYAVSEAFATSSNLTTPSVFVTSEAGTPTLAAVLGVSNDANGTTITGLPEPSTDTEAATKKYVDDNADGGTPTLAEVVAEGNVLSRLRATAAALSGIASGVATALHWTADEVVGTDIAIDGLDNTKINFATAGVYAVTLWVEASADTPGDGEVMQTSFALGGMSPFDARAFSAQDYADSVLAAIGWQAADAALQADVQCYTGGGTWGTSNQQIIVQRLA